MHMYSAQHGLSAAMPTQTTRKTSTQPASLTAPLDAFVTGHAGMVGIAALTPPYEFREFDAVAKNSPPRMARLIIFPHRQHLRLDQLDEIPCLLRQIPPLPHDHAITP